MTEKELLAKIESLEAANAKLKEKRTPPLTLKVGAKGGVSLYGINSRFPVTLYGSQWERILGHADQIRAFLAENADQLKTKE
jgi:hypothetical protein